MKVLKAGLVAMWAISSLAACSKGGQLDLQPGARAEKSGLAPSAAIDLGGKALIIENGYTADNGVHGWATIQTTSSAELSSSSGDGMVIGKPSAAY